uniref:Lignostilbene-alpha,beta-dioxygenase n=1 Tax=Planktothricoides sp. SpSt-374 TaxID=2282167 RepID=A0A7C3VJZ8_9CYAN
MEPPEPSSKTKKILSQSDISPPPLSPKAVLSTSREEFYGQTPENQPLELIVKQRRTAGDSECAPEDILSEECWQEGQLPADIQGHMFIVGAVGYVGSPKCQGSPYVVEPAQDGWTHLFNGEGMIYRLDFHQTPALSSSDNSKPLGETREKTGTAWMATRIMKTPDHYADKALWENGEDNKYKQQWPHEYPFLKFQNFGITRLSIKLGTRNYLNTAFLPMQFSDGTERLLVTWDAGRPYEINTRTLDLVGPVGWNRQWYPITQVAPRGPFPPILSAAHPLFDSHTDEMFTVNGTKSLSTVLWLSRLFKFNVAECEDRFPLLKFGWMQRLSKRAIGILIDCLKFGEKVGQLLGFGGKDAVYLNRWDGAGTTVEQWEVLHKRRPIKIRQSLHQMALTRDYVLISDSAFKLPFEDLIPGLDAEDPWPIEEIEKFLRSIREYLSYPELPYTHIYIIPRAQLKAGRKTVEAKRVKIAPETAHFLADYDNPDGKITLHVAHTAASDPAEFIHGTDESVYNDAQLNQELKARAGMVVDGMDVSRLGYWVIDGKKGKAEKSAFLYKYEGEEFLWSLSIYAWRGFQPNQFVELYWNCWGSWPELLSKYILEMYENYRERIVPVEKMVDVIIKNGKPANLFRVHIDRSTTSPAQLTIADAYNFPPGYFGNSPQFVPRPGNEDPTNGYIICIVLFSDNLLTDKSELWIFDAQNLSSGPQYRLSHPKLNIGVTIHTTWLSKLETPPPRTDYHVRDDYQDLVAAMNSEAVYTLFEDDVYPHFE